jgi:hypothetical protein
MATEICFPMLIAGRQVTRCIPFAYDPFGWLKHPDPEADHPSPDPWKGSDIAILGVVADLTEALRNPALKARFHELVRSAIDEVNRELPAGVEVRLGTRTGSLG